MEISKAQLKKLIREAVHQILNEEDAWMRGKDTPAKAEKQKKAGAGKSQEKKEDKDQEEDDVDKEELLLDTDK